LNPKLRRTGKRPPGLKFQPVAIVAETATAVSTDDAVVSGFACAFGGTAAAQCFSAMRTALIDRCAPVRPIVVVEDPRKLLGLAGHRLSTVRSASITRRAATVIRAIVQITLVSVEERILRIAHGRKTIQSVRFIALNYVVVRARWVTHPGEGTIGFPVRAP
jgi:hypothetical protein